MDHLKLNVYMYIYTCIYVQIHTHTFESYTLYLAGCFLEPKKDIYIYIYINTLTNSVFACLSVNL